MAALPSERTDKMSEYTAIYEAGESIAELLRREMCPEPVAKPEHIGLGEPQNPEDFQLTLWLYNIEEQKDSGVRTGYVPDELNPNIERFAPMQLKIFLLVSAHSKAPAVQRSADEYRLIGRAMQIIRDNPFIPRTLLKGSLAEQREPVLMEITKLSGEELSRVWNNSTKTIKPSFGVTVSQLLIKSERVRETAARVVTAQFDTRPAQSGEKRR